MIPFMQGQQTKAYTPIIMKNVVMKRRPFTTRKNNVQINMEMN